MSVSVTIKVRREITELADKMVRYGLARSRNHAFNSLIERGLAELGERLSSGRACRGGLGVGEEGV
jgi:hypothetical protein